MACHCSEIEGNCGSKCSSGSNIGVGTGVGA